jgi:hypothetical protein
MEIQELTRIFADGSREQAIRLPVVCAELWVRKGAGGSAGV